MTRLIVILKRHLQRTFHRSRAVIAEIEFAQTLRHDFYKFSAQFNRRFMRQIGKNNVFQTVELIFYRRIDFRIGMTQ